MPNPVPPITCVSIIICDDIFRDEKSHKIALWGTFNSIFTPSVPFTHPRMSLFLTITNGRGAKDVAVCIENARTGESVFEVRGPMRFTSPLDIVDLNLELHSITFPRFGKYWVAVKEEERVVAQRPFNVVKLNKRKKKGQSDEQPTI
jgi:hypothetical protein